MTAHQFDKADASLANWIRRYLTFDLGGEPICFMWVPICVPEGWRACTMYTTKHMTKLPRVGPLVDIGDACVRSFGDFRFNRFVGSILQSNSTALVGYTWRCRFPLGVASVAIPDAHLYDWAVWEQLKL